MKHIALAVLVLALTATPARAEMIDNPDYKLWAKFKPGSSVELTEVEVVKGAKGKPDEHYDRITTETLVEVTADKVVVQTQLFEKDDDNGKLEPVGKPDKKEIKAKVEKPLSSILTGESTTVTDGEVEWQGKKVKCRVVVSKFPYGEKGQTVATEWVVDAVPGGVVKSVMVERMPGEPDDVTTVNATKVVVK